MAPKGKNGTWWKVVLAIIGSGLVTATLVWIWQASTIVSAVKANTTLASSADMQAEINEGDIRDLKKDVTYIREGIDRIEKRLPVK